MTTGAERDRLAEGLGAAILQGLDADGDPAQHLALVRRAAAAEDEVAEVLRQSVLAARAAGHSWAALGAELGMSRQAAQQRFGDRKGVAVDAEDGEDAERWLGPVTAFDEMAELELAGRQGWKSIGAGMFYHLVVQTDTQWEYRRVAWTRPAAAYESGGWTVAVRAFPWLYLVRDTGLAATD